MGSSTYAILSLPRKYRVPLRRKRSRAPLGMTKREAGCLTWLFIPLREPTSAPSGHLLPEEGGRSPKFFPPWESQRNENTAFPVSSFRAKREIFLAQRSNGECERTNSTYAIFSFPHMCSTPPGRKDPSATLGMTIRENGRFHIPFHSIT